MIVHQPCIRCCGAPEGAKGPALAGAQPLSSTHPPPKPPTLLPPARCCRRPQGLSREEAEEIQRGLQPMLKAGQKLSLQESVDPSIIGGVILSMGDKFVDMSILARVKKLQQIVRDAV